MAALTQGQRAAAETFKTARLKTGLSQRRLARLAGVAVGVVQNFERLVTWPDDIRRMKLEGAVGLPIGTLQEMTESHEGQSDLVDEENQLRRRLMDVQKLIREGGSTFPSRDTAARIQQLKAARARIDDELEQLENK